MIKSSEAHANLRNNKDEKKSTKEQRAELEKSVVAKCAIVNTIRNNVENNNNNMCANVAITTLTTTITAISKNRLKRNRIV